MQNNQIIEYEEKLRKAMLASDVKMLDGTAVTIMACFSTRNGG
ncbi:hypothetical protein [Paenibacillus brasilensis]|uniref:Uncharacterized protein n=1 Tax=Paenibacillus brasilensis TaxID=128574 RepID=A0ABU0L4J7_9BACL|nr:hypothetical protein [Paenibacillus brasilensis]MDQ0496196.1 hypothetical protein [Paenibacillus brasilensis]